MPDVSRGSGDWSSSWRREAERFREAAAACYAVALSLAGLASWRSRYAWFGTAAVLLAGLRCERGMLFARRMVGRGHE